MRVKEYITELDDSKKNVVREIRSYEIEFAALKNPEGLYQMAKKLRIDRRAEEFVYAIAVDSANIPMGIFEVSHGNINQSIISPREIFVRLLLIGASNFFLLHNHPSGNTSPSKEDVAVTKRISDVGKLMNLQLLDHLIIGVNDYRSLREDGVL